MQETILIVDDEREIADLVEVYLRNENYRVLKFYEGMSALESVARKRSAWRFWTSCCRI